MERPAPGALAANATLVAREDLTASVTRLRLRPDGGVPAFEPGQYLALGLEGDPPMLQRPYSTASPRGEEDALEFLVRLVPGGALTPRLFRVGAAARVRVGRPKGRFTATADDPRRPVFVATGTGIAPLASMLETRLREVDDGPRRRRPIVVHGVARVPELAYRDRLGALADAGRIAYLPVVSRPAEPANAGWRGATGHVDERLAAVLEAELADPAEIVAFVCGSPGMVAATTARLGALGVPSEAIRTEAYWLAPASP